MTVARRALHARPIDAVQLAEDFFVLAPLVFLAVFAFLASVSS